MGIPLKELQLRIDASTFGIYKAYDKINPFGDERADLQGAIICKTLAQIHGAKNIKLKDFIPEFHVKIEVQSSTEMIAIASAITNASGGTIK